MPIKQALKPDKGWTIRVLDREKVMAELKLLRCALMFFTRIPLRSIEGFDESDQAHAARYLTLVGWFVGLISVLVYVLFCAFVDYQTSIALAMLSAVLVTGAFHEDGLADTFDGLVGGWTPEQRLNIMKDSRIGSYGAIALVFVLLLKFLLLSSLDIHFLVYALIGGAVVSRLAANIAMYFLEYRRLNGSSKVISVVRSYGQKDLAIALLCASPVLLVLPYALVVVVFTLALALPFALWMRARIGGYTGDTLGALQQISEVIFYLAFGIII